MTREYIRPVVLVSVLVALTVTASAQEAGDGLIADEEMLIGRTLSRGLIAQADTGEEVPVVEAVEVQPLEDIIGDLPVDVPGDDAEAPAEAMPGPAAEVLLEETGVEAPVAASAPPAVGGASAGGLDDVLREETLRRRALEAHGRATLDTAFETLRTHQYQSAVDMFEEALQYLGIRAETEKDRKRAEKGLRESLYRGAQMLVEQGRYDAAEGMAQRAALMGDRRAPKLIKQIDDEKESGRELPPPVPKRRWQEKQYKAMRDDIESKLQRGRELYLTGEFDKAQYAFESILKVDPHNTEGIRFLQKTVQRRRDVAKMELEATRGDMVTDVIETWNPRYAELSEQDTPPDTGSRRPRVEESARLRILRQMEDIKIPEIDFRQANINDVVDFLQEASVEFDASEDPEDRRGVNIILNLGSDFGGRSVPETDVSDPFAPALDVPAAGGSEVPLITFSARYISLLEALKIVTEVAQLKFRIEGNVVMIVRWDAPDGAIIHRMYNVLPTFIERIRDLTSEMTKTPGRDEDFLGMGQGGVDREMGNLKDFFKSMGVPWPAGSSIRYIPAVGRLVVANTAESLTTFEKILEVINAIPFQIEIEARFVEVAQTDLNSLGFEWLLTDDWELLTKKNQTGPLGAQERIIVPQNEAARAGFTRGNRFLTDVGALGNVIGTADDILSVASVLTNPELKFVLHALEQKGNADLLSAPKVTTQSGAEATIKVVTEYIYPTEFTVEGLQSVVGDQSTQVTTGAVVEPGGFETREVGVILAVLPEVSPEGQMINLTMSPEVVSEPEWRNYGTSFTDIFGSLQQLNMEQPFFHTRTVSTSIAIYNEATVVMGGMITEERTDVDDKVPLLGDIPILGRLFRSRYEESVKRNLLIFVTARLVDPAGRAVKRPNVDEFMMPEMAGAEVAE